MQNGLKTVWSIPYVSVTFFPSLKQNFIAYRSSKVSDCIFEIHQLWQSGSSRVYSNSYSSCPFKPEIIKIGQSSRKMYSNNIVNFWESTTILNAFTKKVWKLIVCTSYAINPNEADAQLLRINCQDVEMESGIVKYEILIMKNEKKEKPQ